MKRNLLWALLGWLSLLTFGARAQTTTLAQETFEDGASGANPRYGYTTVVPFTPTSTRFFERKLVTNNSYNGLLGTATGAAINGTEGTYLWAARSVRSTSSSNINSNSAAVLQLNDIAAANYNNLRITVAFADPSGTSRNTVVNAQRIRLQYSFDGSPWVTVGLILGNSEQTGSGGYYQEDTAPLDSIPDGIILSQTFQDITANINATGTTLRVRIVADTRLPQFVFDNVRVLGTLNAAPKPALANLETTAASYTEAGSPVAVTSALTVGYSNGSTTTTLTGATVKVSANFVANQDRLTLPSPVGNITGSYSSSTGVLTLTGTDTQANYQTALRSVTYSNDNSTTLTSGTRQLSFQVYNGSTALSNTPVRTLNVTASLNSPAALPYTENFDTEGEGLRYLGNSFVSTAATAGFFRATTSPATSGGSPIGNVNFTGWSGGYWYGENTKLNAVPSRTIQLAPVNAAGAASLKFVIAVGSSSTLGSSASWNPGGYFKLYYRANGGSWTEFGSFTPDANGVLRRGGSTDSAAIGPALRYVTFQLPAAAAVSNLDFQLTQLSDGDEELAFDNIRISAAVAPTVTTNTPATSITTTSAVLGGNVTSNGGGTLTERGVVYVVGTGTPTVSNTKALVSTSGVLTGAFSGTVSGLSSNTTYTVRAYAINEAGPGYGASVTFTTLAPVGGTTVVTNVSCNGGSNGAINLTPSGGVAPYTFLWSPGGQTTEDRTGLAAGTYTVTITDATGATGTVSATVTQPSALTAATSQTNIACNGAATGVASVSPIGGTSPYTYRWSTGATTQTITGLAAGSYSVVITDANGCTLTRSFIIMQPSALTATTSQTNVTTSGGNNGSATITVSGGTPNYTYSWSPNVSTTATASNLSAGTYTVTVTDANGCTIARTFTITQPAFTATAQPVTVQLDASGSGTLNASSVNNGSTGSGTLTYTIQKIAFGYIPEGTTPLTLTTPNGASFTQIRFASYGTPNNNSSGNYTLGSCNAANSLSTAQNAYVGRSTGDMYASNTDTRNNPVLGDPCGGTPKALAVQVGYSADAASLAYDCTEAGKTQYVLLTVSNGTSTSTSVAQVTVTAPPTATISSVSPTSAQRGATVTVAGTNLSGVSSVTVNGATATVSNLTSTGFTFVVPSTATFGTGSIVVATPCAQTLTNTFTVVAPTIVVAPASLPNGQQGTAYSQALSASGGTAPYSYAITAGALPSGLTLSSSGTIAGTPTTNGTFTFTVTATDASAYSGSRSYSLVINAQPQTAAPVVTAPANGSFSNIRSVTATGTAPAGSTVSIFIGSNLAGTTPASASGTFSYLIPGNAPDGTYTVSATAQSSGATVSPVSNINTFTIDGTAPTAALRSATVTSSGTTSTSPVSFTATFNEPVTGLTAAGLTVTNGTVTSGPTAGSGNTYTFQVTPSAAGTVTVQVAANAAQDWATNGNTASALYSFTFVAPTIAVAPASLPNGQQGTAYSQALSASGGTAPYSYAITAGALPAGLTLTNGTIAGTPTTNGTFTFTVTATDASAAPGPYSGSQAYSLVIAAPAITATTWTGTISTDWFTAGNWTQGVPSTTIDATIPTAPSGRRFPNVSAGTATARNLTFDSGATLTQSGGTLALAANLTNNGTFLPTGGTVNLGSTTLSSVLGSSNIRFWNLIVGTSGAQLSTSIGASVQRLLTINGNFATNGNSFVLESTNTLTALVVNTNTSVVTGTVTVQRAIDGSVNPGLGYRHYSSPVSNSTVGDLATSGFTPVVNPAFNTVASPYTITPYPTVYGYDDSRLSLTNNLDMFDKGYFSPSALSDPLAVGKGYTVNIAASELVDFQGTLNNGDLSLNLTSTRNTYPADGGWQFLGNPYPAPLDYSRVAAADRLGLESAIYVYSSTSQYLGRYRVYINGIGNPVVPLGQGFFTRVAAGQSTATMTFRNSQRLTAPNGTTLQRPTADPRPLVQLTLQSQGAAPADEAYVYFENGATTGFEPAFDAEKLPNPTGFNLSTTQAGKQLSIDGQPELGTTQRVVPLAVGVPAAGVYTFTASQLLNLSATPVYLRDLQLGTLTDLRQQPTYQFTVSNAAALNTTRFALVFSPQQALATAPAALAEQVGLYPNPARTQVAIELPLSLSRQPVAAALLDALGRVVRQQALPAGLATHTMPLADLATGVYSLRLTTEKGTVVKKLVVE